MLIHTAITRNYDQLKDLPEGLRGKCFSNDKIKPARGWEIVPIPYFHLDPVKLARWVKTHPFELSDEQEILWIDANLKIIGPVPEVDSDFAIDKHPIRNCVYQECMACRLEKKEVDRLILDIEKRYKKLGMPKKNGLWETNVIFYRPPIETILEQWWDEILQFSRRDQVSLPWVMFKNKMKPDLLVREGWIRKYFHDYVK